LLPAEGKEERFSLRKLMLARQFMLKSAEINTVKKEGKLFQSEDFGAAVLKRNDDGPSRFAFVISTKISKMAVNRRRMSRAMIESVRYNFDLLPKNFDVVFLAKTSMTGKSTDEIMQQVKEFMMREDIKK
jgi:ribonuclease P protein component